MFGYRGKGKRATIIKPEFLTILYELKKEKLPGVCANMYCGHRFTFKGSFIIKKMKPHIKECKKREEKRGSYPWIKHFCEKCGKKFVWDVPIYIRVTDKGKIQFNYELKTMKFLGPIKRSLGDKKL